MLEIACTSLLIGFTGSRIAVMLFDFMCYGGIFWKFKFWIASRYYTMPDLTLDSVSEGHQKLQTIYDFLSTKSFIIGLLDCKFCMTVWTCGILAIVGILFYSLSWLCLIYGIILGYLITEKL